MPLTTPIYFPNIKSQCYELAEHCYLFVCKQIVDDVEFWFPPGKKPIVEYRSASRLGNFDFEVNRKRIKVSFPHSVNMLCRALRIILPNNKAFGIHYRH